MSRLRLIFVYCAALTWALLSFPPYVRAQSPHLSSISPTVIAPGMQMTLTGSGLGASQNGNRVALGTAANGTPVSWTDTQIVVIVPATFQPGNASVVVNGVASNGIAFTTVPPVLTSISPTAIAPGMQMTLTGSGFGAVQNGRVALGTAANGTPVSWTDTRIVVTVPATFQPGNVQVMENGGTSNGIAFTTMPPVLTSISPTAIAPGMQMTLTGSGFGAVQNGRVALGNAANGTVVSWTDARIVVTVPAGVQPGNASVLENGGSSNGIAFTVVPGPSITSLSSTSGPVGKVIVVTGNNLGTQGTLTFNGTAAAPTNWTATSITAPVPVGATTGNVVVTISSLASNGVNFTVLPTPNIASLSPTSGPVGTSVSITGTNFGSTQGSSIVSFNGTPVTTIGGWNPTQITATVPAGAATGNIVVTVNSVPSNGLSFTVLPTPNIASLSPISGSVGTSVSITGTNFGSTQGSSTVSFNGTPATTIGNWNPTQITATVPAGATTGNVVVTVNGVPSNGLNFTVVAGTSLNTSRYQHSATLLNNGKILIAGGVTCPSASSCSYLSSAEVYDPATGTSVNTGSMATPRAAPAVLLANGKVLIAGGATCDYGNCGSQNTAEVYDPVTGTFSSGGTLQSARDGQTMTLLADGRVLIAGGEFCSVSGGSENRSEPLFGDARLVYASFSPVIFSTTCSALRTVEVYDPVSGVFTYTEPMHTARYNAAATRLADGRVLIVGGSDEFNPLYSAEIYDPSDGTFTELPSGLGLPRTSPAATLLDNGLVLISGGSTLELPLSPTNSAELYDPSAGAFRFTSGSMRVQRVGHTATLLTNGQVLLAGGSTACSQSCSSDATTELYNPVSNAFATSQALVSARAVHGASLASDGKAYLIGGIANGTTLASVESYSPSTMAPPSLVGITVIPANPSVLIGETRQMTAVGTFSDGSTQSLQSALWTSSSTDVTTIANAAGSNGIISPKGTGSSMITATLGNVSGSTLVTVPQLVSLSLYPQNAVVTLGESQQLMARARFTDGSVHDQTSAAIWTSSDTSIAVVGNDSGRKGFVFGLIPASATITAAIGSITATTGVTIMPPQSAPPAPFISGMTPTSGITGTPVTITGTGFGSAQRNGIVWLGSTYGAVVSWSDTQVVATVAPGASSGEVQIQQSGLWSNTYDFLINAPTISSISPTSGIPGTQVTITGSGFGSDAGSIWLGTANGTIVSWADGQVVATVAPGSTSGVAQILQSGVMSNAVIFTVNVPRIANVSPGAGSPGTTITISGTGFGSAQGNGSIQLGSTAGVVSSWNDTQIVAWVGASAQNGIVQVTQNGIQSNFKNFTVPPNGNSTNAHITPDLMTMIVGESRPLQALDANGADMQGLNWAVSDSTVASLSTDDPPLLTALVPGHITITAGDSSADLTVYPDPVLPLGTVIWSTPGDGSGVVGIGPAVPSSDGVADVFAYQASGKVQAITTEGKVAWTADVSAAKNTVADFQGGLVVQDATTIKKLDGMAGTAYPAYTFSNPPQSGSPQWGYAQVLVHTDGTIFTVDGTSVVGIDPKTGRPKFSVPIDDRITWSIQNQPGAVRATGKNPPYIGNMIIAGDGNAYVPYEYWTLNNSYSTDQWFPYEEHDKAFLKVLRVSSGGNWQTSLVKEWDYDVSRSSFYVIDRVDPFQYFYGCSWIQVLGVPYFDCEYCRSENGCPQGHTVATTNEKGVQAIAVAPYSTPPAEGMPDYPLIPFGYLITNADMGAVLPVGPVGEGYAHYSVNPGWDSTTPFTANSYLATIPTGGGASLAKLNLPEGYAAQPMLQREDGSFIGTAVQAWSNSNWRMIAFNAAGNQIFSITGFYQPQIATTDGGFIATPDYRTYAKFDQNGKSTGQLPSLPTHSWKGAYELGSTNAVPPVLGNLTPAASSSFAATTGGNFAGNGNYHPTHTLGLSWCGTTLGDVQCNSNNVQYRYYRWTDQTLQDATSYASDHPEWLALLKVNALIAFKRALGKLPIMVQPKADGAEFVAYVKDDDPEACGRNFGSTSEVYYNCPMTAAQQALGHPSGEAGCTNPWCTFSPLLSDTAGMREVINAIGTGIGNAAAHEVSHYISSMPVRDCGLGNRKPPVVACDNHDNFVYEFYSGQSGLPQDSNNENSGGAQFFYVDVPGHPIHWGHRDFCRITDWAGLCDPNCQ